MQPRYSERFQSFIKHASWVLTEHDSYRVVTDSAEIQTTVEEPTLCSPGFRPLLALCDVLFIRTNELHPNLIAIHHADRFLDDQAVSNFEDSILKATEQSLASLDRKKFKGEGNLQLWLIYEQSPLNHPEKPRPRQKLPAESLWKQFEIYPVEMGLAGKVVVDEPKSNATFVMRTFGMTKPAFHRFITFHKSKLLTLCTLIALAVGYLVADLPLKQAPLWGFLITSLPYWLLMDEESSLTQRFIQTIWFSLIGWLPYIWMSKRILEPEAEDIFLKFSTGTLFFRGLLFFLIVVTVGWRLKAFRWRQLQQRFKT